VAIDVTAAFQQVADLRAKVTELWDAGWLSDGRANALIANLQLKGTRWDVGNLQEFLQAGIRPQAQADDLNYWGNILLLSVTRRAVTARVGVRRRQWCRRRTWPDRRELPADPAVARAGNVTGPGASATAVRSPGRAPE
jgi:hypothetical protein